MAGFVGCCWEGRVDFVPVSEARRSCCCCGERLLRKDEPSSFTDGSVVVVGIGVTAIWPLFTSVTHGSLATDGKRQQSM